MFFNTKLRFKTIYGKTIWSPVPPILLGQACCQFNINAIHTMRNYYTTQDINQEIVIDNGYKMFSTIVKVLKQDPEN